MKELKPLIEEELHKVFQENRNAGQVYVGAKLKIRYYL